LQFVIPKSCHGPGGTQGVGDRDSDYEAAIDKILDDLLGQGRFAAEEMIQASDIQK
jgi:hypothetical protein